MVVLLMELVVQSRQRHSAAKDVSVSTSNGLALLFIVDKSGSMAGDSIEAVKQGCIHSAHLLAAKDYLGVIAFDVRPHRLLPFMEAARQPFIDETITRLGADGGTHLYPALVEALREFQEDGRIKACAAKHAIIISDGDTPHANFEWITRQIAQEGITVSSVCVGCGSDNFDAPLMSRIADWGRGRFIFVSSIKQLPRILAQETTRVLTKAQEATPTPFHPPGKSEKAGGRK